MTVWDWFSVVLTLGGVLFFAAGTLGILRFPDVFSRINGLTKADNLGLGLIVLGLAPQTVSIFDAVQLLMIWILVLISGAVTSFLVANYAFEDLRRSANGTAREGSSHGR